MTREEAIRLIGWLKCTTNREDDLEAIDMAIEALSERTGEWIFSTKQLEIVPMWECSCCRIRAAKKFNYCPNCGARMKGGDDE